ncbi:cobalamin biosynthesis protein [Pseudodonghicola flavimaris]|uniref:Cobalamin biosynthesis protein n=1 Tax=Pseudodonghicola flavimaris TaxID=3050036 RepID=A0ABT7F1D3_9RHOB|nr:cobalamin biosynthesis protein [Pseudodonghicola flavimaris]MDK3018415.1 cobalamin biosynthesis protein [Pseudodonghicola flavimaris]
MRVAGIGFRAGAPVAALRAALDLAGGAVEALATLDRKADAPQIRALAAERGLPVLSMTEATLGLQITLTQSPNQIARFGTGSLAEAAALAAAGPGARLTGSRVISPCGMATAAIAEGPKT